jgi:hypothetical protein
MSNFVTDFSGGITGAGKSIKKNFNAYKTLWLVIGGAALVTGGVIATVFIIRAVQQKTAATASSRSSSSSSSSSSASSHAERIIKKTIIANPKDVSFTMFSQGIYYYL